MKANQNELPKLTKRQARALSRILTFCRSHRHTQTHHYINKAMRASTMAAAISVEPLIKQGDLDNSQQFRSIKPPRPTKIAAALKPVAH